MEIASGVHLVDDVRWSRVYLIVYEKLALIDSGPPGAARKVLSYIRSIGRDPQDLEYVLMTHSHPDHTAGANPLLRATEARLLAHRGDTKTPAGGRPYLSYLGVLSYLRAPLPYLKGTPVDQTVEDGQMLPIQDGLSVVHTPGHTPGSTCYLLEGPGVLFSGDTLFSDGESISRSVPYPKHNAPDFRTSMDKLAGIEFDVLCGGHGAPLLSGASKVFGAALAAHPDPPTWGAIVKRMPGRIAKRVGGKGRLS